MIAESIKAFGFTNPILTDENNVIVAGHGRVEAAKLIGMAKVPTVRLDNLSHDQIRAYVIADNRLAEKTGWDESILAIELQHLLTVDLGFEVSITGFEVPEIACVAIYQLRACRDLHMLLPDGYLQPRICRRGLVHPCQRGAVRADAPATKCSIKRLCKPQLKRFFRIRKPRARLDRLL